MVLRKNGKWEIVNIPSPSAKKNTPKTRSFTYIQGREHGLTAQVIHHRPESQVIRIFVARKVNGADIAPVRNHNSSQHAINITTAMLSCDADTGQQMRIIAETLHPQDIPGPHPQVEVAVADIEINPDGLLETTIHRAGRFNIFVLTDNDGWIELPNSGIFTDITLSLLDNVKRVSIDLMNPTRIFKPNHLRMLSDLTSQIPEELLGKITDGYNSVFGEQLREITNPFSAWNCPPLGMFAESSTGEKIEKESINNIKAIIISTLASPITLKTLNEQNSPEMISSDSFRHTGSVALAALSRKL